MLFCASILKIEKRDVHMPIHIIKIIKTSLREVFHHKKEWIRLAFAPFIVWSATLLLSSLSTFYSPLLIISNSPFSVGEILALSSGGLHVLGYFVSTLILEINGFRYTVLGEKRNTWWVFHLNRRFVKLLVYVLLVQGIGTLYSLTTIFSLMEIQAAYENLALTATSGIFLGLLACYLVFRLGFFKLLISIDTKAPLRESWHLLKGHVMRLFGLTFFVILGFISTFFLVGFGIGLGLLFFFDTQPPIHLVVLPLSVITWFFSWATLTQAYTHVYKELKGKKIKRKKA